ncbi:MAG: efflux RND transporter periplasmic adaptor subunit [Syntrophorhabdaceae bacterium]|nr:efflux RND transporter periplasmic adaptor subunit [Syntrophorhabdaceae bacterium]
MVLLVAVVAACQKRSHDTQKANENAAHAANSRDSLTITEQQARHIEVISASSQEFAVKHEAVGMIDFNQDSTVHVWPPYQGRIRQVFARAGDDVKEGQTLFLIDIPELLTAESELVAASSALTLAVKALDRMQKMRSGGAAAEKDLEQAISEHQTAEGAYKAARDAVRIFGRSDSEIDSIEANRQIGGGLPVRSPIHGRVTGRNASPGSLVQLDAPSAPFTVADISTLWMIAYVSEHDFPQLKLGQPVSVSVMAYPGRKFQGRIVNIGAAVDPDTRRIAVRSEIKDPKHELRAQMLASFLIHTGTPHVSPAVPVNSVVREGDGAQVVFVQEDDRHFIRRPVKTGLTQNGVVQIFDGLSAGEKIAGDGALFLHNALTLQSR